MNLILGMLIVFGSVLGGYVLSHGKLLALWQPYELLILCGAALGSFVIANPMSVIKKVFKALPLLLTGSPYNKALHMDLFALLFDIATKIRKTGLMSLEADIDAPDTSEVFKKYPKILKDHHVMDFLTDNLRVIVAGSMAPHDFEALLDHELGTHEEEAEKASEALTRVSDALPGFGIVAAVMGIVITMSLIGGDPKLLGEHVGAALVGTFLGILLAYGFVGPMSTALQELAKVECKFFDCIKVFLVSITTGTPPSLSVEYARRLLYANVKPSFQELEEHVKKK